MSTPKCLVAEEIKKAYKEGKESKENYLNLLRSAFLNLAFIDILNHAEYIRERFEEPETHEMLAAGINACIHMFNLKDEKEAYNMFTKYYDGLWADKIMRAAMPSEATNLISPKILS